MPAPELVHTLVFGRALFSFEFEVVEPPQGHRFNVNTDRPPQKRGVSSTLSHPHPVGGLPEFVSNVPQAAHVLSLCREGANGGRLAVQVEDKLVMVRNIKVSRLLRVQFLSLISHNGMFIILGQPFPVWCRCCVSKDTHAHTRMCLDLCEDFHSFAVVPGPLP